MILFPGLFENASVLNPMGQNLSELDRAKYIKGAIFGISGVIKIFSPPPRQLKILPKRWRPMRRSGLVYREKPNLYVIMFSVAKLFSPSVYLVKFVQLHCEAVFSGEALCFFWPLVATLYLKRSEGGRNGKGSQCTYFALKLERMHLVEEHWLKINSLKNQLS